MPTNMDESLARGLAQSAAGEVVDLGTFAQYADEDAEKHACTRDASCGPDDHTYSWPCVLAVTNAD